MFNRNNNGHTRPDQLETASTLDWHEFDQDYEYPANNGNSYPTTAEDSNIPSFGVTKSSSKINRGAMRSGVVQVGGQNPKENQSKPTNGSKKKSARSKHVPSKRDNRWRFFFGLGLFVVGLAGSIMLVQANTKGIEVIVATRDITPGQPITGADFATARMSVPPDLAALLLSTSEMKVLTETNESPKSSAKVAARKLRIHQPIMQGDVISAVMLNKTGVPDGMVAMALPVSASTAAARITPGDTVSLLYVNSKSTSPETTGKVELSGEGRSGLETLVLAERITVLDVARSGSAVNLGGTGNNTIGDSSASTGSRSTITNLTLLLTLEQAQKLSIAKESGTINVVLLPFQVQSEKPGEVQKPPEVSDAKPTPSSTPDLTIKVSPVATFSPMATVPPTPTITPKI